MPDRLQIKGYKSIRDLDLELRPLNVLIGANGSGKSNLLSFFKMMRELMERRLQVHVAREGGAETLLHFGSGVTEALEFRAYLGSNGYEVRLLPTASDNLYFGYEKCWFHGISNIVPLGSAHSESELAEKMRRPGDLFLIDQVIERAEVDQVVNSIRSWNVYHFAGMGLQAKILKTNQISDSYFLRPDGSNLAAFLYRLRKTHYSVYDRIVRTIRLVAPFFDDFVLEPVAQNPDTLLLRWSERASDTPQIAYTLSDGTLRFICLATLLLQPELPEVLLIDEPELGLHPYAVNLLASLLSSAATMTQVIVATHSVSLVNQLLPEEIVVVDRHEEHSVFERLEREKLAYWLEAYTMGDLWEKNIIGGHPQS